jgi:hypothetical protein
MAYVRSLSIGFLLGAIGVALISSNIDPIATTIWFGGITALATTFMVLELLAVLPWRPAHSDLLALHRVTRQEGDVAYAPRASAFRAFSDRAKRHAEYSGGGFLAFGLRRSLAAA